MVEKVTDKQLKFIRDIEDLLGREFTGSSKKEASEFISKNYDEYRQALELERELDAVVCESRYGH